MRAQPCLLVLCLLLLAADLVSAAPPYSDYDSLRDLYELVQKEAALASGHEMVRKSNRSPSLRLRFGRRADPLWQDNSLDGAAPAGSEK